VNVLQALGRIRRREKTLAEAGSIEIRAWSATTNGSRRSLVLTLRSPERPDLSAMKPTQFAIWEGATLIEDYEISAQPNPALIVSGFVLPRFSSAADPYAIAVLEAMERCLPYKRADDLWRLDRYLIEPRNGEHGPPLEKAALPYEESLLGPFAKNAAARIPGGRGGAAEKSWSRPAPRRGRPTTPLPPSTGKATR